MIPLPPERKGYPAPADVAAKRAGMAAAVAAGTWITDPPAVETMLGGRRALRFRPAGAPRGFVLHFHGGGFRIGAPEATAPLAVALAARCGVEVVAPQYRLAPEHPFPGGLADALSALSGLRREIGDAPLIVSGDSAGGGLAAAMAVQGGVKIDGLVLLSPWLDTTVTAPSVTENADDPLFPRASAEIAAGLYLQGQDPTHPLASPLLAEIKAFPPTFLSVGLEECLRDDSLRMHEKLRAGGVASELLAISGMEHVAVIRNKALPGAVETFEAVAAFIDGIVCCPSDC